MHRVAVLLALACLTFGGALPLAAAADDAGDQALAKALEQLDSRVLNDEQRAAATSQLRDQLQSRLRAANEKSTAAWEQVKTAADWQSLRQQVVTALRNSLGHPAKPPEKLNYQVTGTLTGDGFTIDNVVYESHPGIWVTANLYKPQPARDAMPGIIICHAHHTPKEHTELQDMGMTWARRGCLVLVGDQLGHGERRQHPFRTASDYAGSFRPSRQDYYFRYDSSLQLYLAGESLAGRIAWDLMRGVDLLLATPGIDAKKILLLGSVAGGGDPAAVAAALDDRITAAGIFNFGGPQPETRYPLAEDAKVTFNYAGGGSWESTRNLHRSAGDGFLPWGIVASLAPRGLIYAHEFAWDEPHDPVWQRLQGIYQFTAAPDRLTFTHGRGSVRGQAPESTHCTHIGPVHRVKIHEALHNWFGVAVTPGDEYSARRSTDELQAMTAAAKEKLHPRSLAEQLAQLTDGRIAAARALRTDASKSRVSLRTELARLLGNVEPATAKVIAAGETNESVAGAKAQRVILQVEDGIQLPVLMLRPSPAKSSPVVVGVAQEGKSGFLKHRAAEIAALINGGVTVVLADLRGQGEVTSDRDRSRTSGDTSRSATELMLSGTMVGARLRDLRSVIGFVRSQPDCDRQRVALWGESFAAVNPADTNFVVPRDAEKRPAQSEPIGGMLALLAGLFDDEIRAVSTRGGLTGFRSVLDSPYVQVPHDVVVPGLLTVGDLSDIAAALAPQPVRLGDLVDGLNRAATSDQASEVYRVASNAYEKAGAPGKFSVVASQAVAPWLLEQLQGDGKKISADSTRPQPPAVASTAAKIDALLAAHWAAHRVEPAGAASDAELLRRTTLDLVGRVPTTSELQSYLADPSPDKRQRLVAALCAGPEFPLHFANVLDDLIQGPRAGDAAFVGYLRTSLREQKPWDAMFRELLLGPWEQEAAKPANRFLDKRAKDVDVLTVDTTRVFFGVDISCARCHDHPLVPAWKQDHYYGMMAFLNRTQGGKGAVSEKSDGEVKFVSASEGKEKTAPMMFLTGQKVSEPAPAKGLKFSRREQLVATALAERTLLSRAIVNRLWKQLLGRGLVEPIDQMHSGSPAAVPGLLEWLADDFAASGYDLRRLVEAMVSTRVYALSSRWESASDLPNDDLFAVARLRPLAPKPLAVSLLLVAGNGDFDDARDSTGRIAAYDELEKQARSLITNNGGEPNLTEPSPAEALFLSNAPAVQTLFVSKENNLIAHLAAEPDLARRVDVAVRTVLSRPPTDDEQRSLVAWFERQAGPCDAVCSQLVWALAMSPEFRFNH